MIVQTGCSRWLAGSPTAGGGSGERSRGQQVALLASQWPRARDFLGCTQGPCDWTAGDGVGGTEAYVGDAADVQECTALVQSTQPRANGATYPAGRGGTRCYAEFGMARADNSTAWQTCRFPGALFSLRLGTRMSPSRQRTRL